MNCADRELHTKIAEEEQIGFRPVRRSYPAWNEIVLNLGMLVKIVEIFVTQIS